MHSEIAAHASHESAPEAHSGTEHHASPRLYFIVWGLLMLLLVLTIAIGKVDLGGAGNFVVAFSIASVKAVLIVLFFMHVRDSAGLIKIVACAGFFWFAIMLGLTFSDYLSRDWVEPRQAGPAPIPPRDSHSAR
jgi:cytochrome c oxidase subunit IV